MPKIKSSTIPIRLIINPITFHVYGVLSPITTTFPFPSLLRFHASPRELPDFSSLPSRVSGPTGSAIPCAFTDALAAKLRRPY